MQLLSECLLFYENDVYSFTDQLMKHSNWHYKWQISVSYLDKCDFSYWNFIKPLLTELSAQHTLQKTWNLNGHPLLCMFLADDCSGNLGFSASHCPSTIVSLQHQRILTFSRLMTYIYISRTALLTSRCCILYIYSTNTLHTLRFFLFKMPFIS